MTKFGRFSRYILAFLLSISMINSANAMYFSDFVYQSVRKGFSSNVVNFLEKGYDIDAVNPEGKTALCLAIERNDFTSYSRIRRLGADDEPSCLKNVNKKTAKYKIVLAQKSFIPYTPSLKGRGLKISLLFLLILYADIIMS